MMPEIILHIGRHKTGTSSLQRFLSTHRCALENLGIHYPRQGASGLAHHDIARHFFGSRAKQAFSAQDHARHLDSFRALMRAMSGRRDTTLLSSEGFQNCNPKPMARAFPPGRVLVVVYLREQVEYMLSAYQQKVHATNYAGSIDDFAAGFTANYDAFLKVWEDVYGAGRLRVRPYSKVLLKDGDVIADFCETADIPAAGELPRTQRDENPSIGGVLLEFKRLLNRVVSPEPTSRPLYAALSALAAERPEWRARPMLQHDLASALRRTWRASNQRVCSRYPQLEPALLAPIASPVGGLSTPIDAEAFSEVGEALKRADPAVHAHWLHCAAAAAGIRIDYDDPARWADIMGMMGGVANRYRCS